MKTHKFDFKIEKTAKICQIGEITSETKNVWFVLHGYGQLADYFIRNFQEIANSETVIIAPEGLARFYQKGFYGRVGASWMTKEERKTDIEDYCNYLDQLHNYTFQNIDLENINITVLGFSQGGATVARWLDVSDKKIDNLILWSSIFPNDLPSSGFNNLFSRVNCKLVFGTKDPFINSEHDNQIQFLETEHQNVEVHTFDGEHIIDKPTLLKIKNAIDKR